MESQGQMNDETGTVRSGDVACQKVIRSGGGFSNVLGVPGYQRGGGGGVLLEGYTDLVSWKVPP